MKYVWKPKASAAATKQTSKPNKEVIVAAQPIQQRKGKEKMIEYGIKVDSLTATTLLRTKAFQQTKQVPKKPTPSTAANISTRSAPTSVQQTLNAWNTFRAWSANSQVADYIVNWHKSLESGITSPNVLGF